MRPAAPRGPLCPPGRVCPGRNHPGSQRIGTRGSGA